MRIAIFLALTLTVVLNSASALAQQSPAEIDVSLHFRKVLQDQGGHDALVFVGEQGELLANWGFQSLGPDAVTLPPLPEHVSMTFAEGQRAVATEIEWSVEVEFYGYAGDNPLRRFRAPMGSLTLQSRDEITAQATVRRVDGRSWAPGVYQAQFDVRSLLGSTTVAPQGAPWTGKANRFRRVEVQIRPVSSPQDWKQFHQIEARHARSVGNFDSAIGHFEALTRLDPAWYNFMALGDAYYRAGRHPEAVRTLEPILPHLLARERDHPRVTKLSW